VRATDREEFEGTGRFELRRRLGAGGFGVVYEAVDRERGTRVALKVLRASQSDALYDFKQEFRALADIVHPNLVSLYELLSEGGRWFFTMELVKGRSFLDWVWEQPRPERDPAAPTQSMGVAPTAGVTPTGGPEPVTPSRSAFSALPFVAGRLRSGVGQLAAGITALHAAGKLHRDIKPSNVLVTEEGRVVVLDFGLVADLEMDPGQETTAIVGTPAYMSPEQGEGVAVTEASDWYAVGVMLYEALTGRVPFSGPFADVVLEKRSRPPIPPSELVEGVPEDLEALAVALLDRDPRRRPSGREVLRALGATAPEVAATAAVSPPPFAGAALVGREEHLGRLEAAYAESRRGRAVAALLPGRSGMGKTALARHFLEGLRQTDPDAVVLAGRCYEQESVPYKALDSAVDALSRQLRKLSREEAQALLPGDLLALERVFPVLRSVEAVQGAPRRVLDIPDPQELRRRAFSALRELLTRLATRRPLVLFLDDLQWGDEDSAALLGELLRPPDPPALLFLAAYRDEDAEGSPLLRRLLPALPQMVEVRAVPVGDLAPEDARALALRRLDEDGAGAQARAEAIARESRGNPFFIDELARYARPAPGTDDRAAGAPAAPPPAASLSEVIRARVARLPRDAQRLLEVLAVAGQPLELAVAREAARLGGGEEHATLRTLRSGHLVRTAGTREGGRIETFHDRIREAVARSLAPEALRSHHQALARSLEASGRADPESLAVHYRASGDEERAARYAVAAAGQAAAALAFDRAARLYRFALELRPVPGVEVKGLRVRLGDALASAGRGGEAAQAYLLAAREADGAEAVELRRRVAEQLLISGHIDEGSAALRDVLRMLGLRLPASPKGALFRLLARRVLLRLRGYGFRERPASEVSPEELIRIDTCWSVVLGLSFVDTVRGAEFQTRHLLFALRAGEPYRVARALALEAGHAATAGSRGRRRTETLSAMTTAIAERVNHPHALALATFVAGMACYLEGRWRKAHEQLDRAEEIFRERCTGVAWERDNAQLYSLRNLFFMGELAELQRRLPSFIEDVERRGDLYAKTHLARVTYVMRLAEDSPAAALRELDAALEGWSRQGFMLQHFWDLIGRGETALYRGDAEEAHRIVCEGWPRMRRSLYLRIQFSLVSALSLRGRAALAVAALAGGGPGEGEARLREALGDARRLERERVEWGVPLARLIQAGAASVAGRAQEAIERLIAAERAAEATDMALHAAVARRCRGLLLGGEGGRSLCEAADAWMAGQRIRSPERMSGMLCPGRWSG